MQNNALYTTRDFKEQIDIKWLNKAINDINKFDHGIKIHEESGESDDFVTLVLPENIYFSGINFDMEILDYSPRLSVNEAGEFFFKFDAQCGMPATIWLNEEDASTWVAGIESCDELLNTNIEDLPTDEFEELTAAKFKALTTVKYHDPL